MTRPKRESKRRSTGHTHLRRALQRRRHELHGVQHGGKTGLELLLPLPSTLMGIRQQVHKRRVRPDELPRVSVAHGERHLVREAV